MSNQENLKSQNVTANRGWNTHINKASINELNFIIGKIKHTLKLIKKSSAKSELEED